MYYIKSTSQKTYVVNGKIIPACVTPENDYLVVDSAFVTEIKKMPVIASLIRNGNILILDKEPEELKNSIKGLSSSNAELIATNTELQKQVEELQKQLKTPVDDIEAIKKEAIDEITKRQEELDKANAEIERLKKRLSKKGEE